MPTGTFLYNLGFYGLLLPVFLWLIVHERATIQRDYNVGTLSLMVFFAFVALHGVLWQPSEQPLSKTLLDTLWNALFVTMAYQCFRLRAMSDTLLPKALMVTTIIFACVSMTRYGEYAAILASGEIPTHSWMIGRAHNPIPIGSLYAMAALMSVWLMFQASPNSLWKSAAALCMVLTLIVILMSSQRGPLLALFIAGGVALIVLKKWRLLALSMLPMVVVAADYYYYTNHGASALHLDALHATIHHYFTGRDSFRLAIWHKALELASLRPWQGYGLQAKFTLTGAEGAVNPHNLYLSTLYYLGIPGLGLLLVPLATAFVYAWRGRHTPYHQLCLILLVHAVAATFTNYGQVVKAPAPLWTIYWLPIVMAIARPPIKPRA